MKKKNNKLLLWISIILFIVVLVGFFVTAMTYYPYWFGLEKRTFYTSVNISANKGGFDLNKTALTFGKMNLDGSASRGIIFDNQYDFPVVAKISVDGKINSLLSYENDVLIDKNETKTLGFVARTTNETELGFYDGYITIKVVPAV